MTSLVYHADWLKGLSVNATTRPLGETATHSIIPDQSFLATMKLIAEDWGFNQAKALPRKPVSLPLWGGRVWPLCSCKRLGGRGEALIDIRIQPISVSKQVTASNAITET